MTGPAPNRMTAGPEDAGAAVGRAGYGYDAPRVLMALVLAGAAAVAVAGLGVAAGWAAALTAVIAAVALADMTIVGSYVYTTRIGKHHAWAGILDSLALRGEETALDLGCGRGAVLIPLARRLPRGHVTGVDVWQTRDQSGNGEAVTRRNAVLEGVADRVTIKTDDIRVLSCEADSFDVVTSSLVLHNLPSAAERALVLENALRVLKPGGRLLVVDIRNIDEYSRVLHEYGTENLAVRDFGLRAAFGIPRLRLRLISGSKPAAGCAASSRHSLAEKAAARQTRTEPAWRRSRQGRSPGSV